MKNAFFIPLFTYIYTCIKYIIYILYIIGYYINLETIIINCKLLLNLFIDY